MVVSSDVQTVEFYFAIKRDYCYMHYLRCTPKGIILSDILKKLTSAMIPFLSQSGEDKNTMMEMMVFRSWSGERV